MARMLELELVAHFRQPAEPAQHITRQRTVFVFVVQQAFDFQRLFEMMQVGTAVDYPFVFAGRDDVGSFIFVREIAGDRLEDVYGRDQPFHGAKLVNDDDQLTTRSLERFNQIEDAHGFMHDDGRTQFVLVKRTVLYQVSDHVFGTTYANDVVQRTLADRKEHMGGAADFLADLDRKRTRMNSSQ